MRQTELRLANKDKRTIEAIRSTGWRMAREVNRAIHLNEACQTQRAFQPLELILDL